MEIMKTVWTYKEVPAAFWKKESWEMTAIFFYFFLKQCFIYQSQATWVRFSFIFFFNKFNVLFFYRFFFV